jgi:hypothetical protein
MRDLKRLWPLIVNTSLMLALVSAVLLSSCAKNSGSFQNSPAERLRAQSQEGQNQTTDQTLDTPAPANNAPATASAPSPVTPTVAPTAATTPTPASAPAKASAPSDSEYRSKIQIQNVPPAPSEFQAPTGSVTISEGDATDRQTFEHYKDIKATQDEAKTAAEAIFDTFPLAWEIGKNPERRNWTRYAYKVIDQNFASLDQVQDSATFCKHYNILDKKYKMIFWGMLVSEIAFHESSWNPTARSLEDKMGIDGVTKMQVYSEGLMQLSYQDTQWSPYCKFDWSQDQKLTAKDPQRTILDPYLNLACGIKVLADQIHQYKQIAMQKNVYWSVLHQDGKYSKIPDMAAGIQRRLPFCQ